MGISVGICGIGQFARSFIPLYLAHPGVREVVLADVLPERAKAQAERFGIRRTYDGLEQLCASDVDAIVLLTQRHLHGAQTLEALDAGKHVYCAVPIAQSIDEIRAIVDRVSSKRLIYMTGETSYYYPSTIYCRERHARGDFGHIFYGEAQYLHDMTHGFYDAFKHSGGASWKRVAGFPPMFYPTHSVSMILSVTGARATHVSCLGWEDRHDDGIFRVGGNHWDNPYSNQTALMRTSDGGMCRINEFRRVGWSGGNSVHMSLFGTQASFEEQAGAQVWVELDKSKKVDLSEALACSSGASVHHDAVVNKALRHEFFSGVAGVHPVKRLPDSFRGLPNGHYGSHQFLVDDFVKAVNRAELPPNHVWNAAKYCAPGLVAHESSKRNGEILAIPDFGDPPSDWTLLNPI